MLTFLKRITRAGWINFKRNGGLSTASVFIMAMSLSLMTALFLMGGAVEFLIADLQSKVDIAVYFKKDSAETEILKIKEEVAKLPEVRDVTYVSEKNALDDFVQRHKDDPALMASLDQVGGNPLLASLNIRAWQASQYAAVVSFFDSNSLKDMVEKIDYGKRKPIIEKLFSATAGINRVGILLSIALSCIAIVVAFNTIRLAIFNLKEEIAIMRLVGASNWFIRGPFVIQGVISGFIAALITLILSVGITFFLSPKMEALVPGFSIFSYFLKNFSLILLGQFAIGILLGVIASAVAMRKHLEV